MTDKTFPNAHLEGLLAHYNAQGWQHCGLGTCFAISAFNVTNDSGLDTLTVWNMPSIGDMPGFLDTLAEAGITEFLLCDRSSGLMDVLHYLLDRGWQIIGTYERQDRYSPLLGLRMRKAVA